MTDAQTEARAIAWRGEYKQPGTDRWIVRYVDDGEPKGKNWRNVTPLVDATALAAKDAELAAERAALRLAADRADRAEAQLAEANKALDPDALASTVANIKQGESSTPRCEPPSEYDVNIARAWVVRVLKAIEYNRAARRAREQGGGNNG